MFRDHISVPTIPALATWHEEMAKLSGIAFSGYTAL
jgi:hypothetical protein